ncbi:MAG: hypothetical protein R3F46_03590 [bacterium]
MKLDWQVPTLIGRCYYSKENSYSKQVNRITKHPEWYADEDFFLEGIDLE